MRNVLQCGAQWIVPSGVKVCQLEMGHPGDHCARVGPACYTWKQHSHSWTAALTERLRAAAVNTCAPIGFISADLSGLVNGLDVARAELEAAVEYEESEKPKRAIALDGKLEAR